MEEGYGGLNRCKITTAEKGKEVIHDSSTKEYQDRFLRSINSCDFVGSARVTGLRHYQISISDALAFGGEDREGIKVNLEEGSFLPHVVTKLEFDHLSGLHRTSVRFKAHELNHILYQKMALIGVIYSSPIVMKGISLGCKNKWKALSGSFSISVVGFKCLLLVFEMEEDKVWVMRSRPWYLFQKVLLNFLARGMEKIRIFEGVNPIQSGRLGRFRSPPVNLGDTEVVTELFCFNPGENTRFMTTTAIRSKFVHSRQQAGTNAIPI